VLLGRNHARPRCTVRGADVAPVRGPRPRGARPGLASAGAARAAHGGATRGGTARRAGDDMTPVRGKRLRSSGSPARERRTAARRRRASSGQDCGGVGEAVGVAARSARRSGDGRRGRGDGRGDGGAREAALSGWRGRGGALSGQRVSARRAAADRWGPLSVISELKFTPKEISSN
jgi:hypothetical protein